MCVCWRGGVSSRVGPGAGRAQRPPVVCRAERPSGQSRGRQWRPHPKVDNGGHSLQQRGFLPVSSHFPACVRGSAGAGAPRPPLLSGSGPLCRGDFSPAGPAPGPGKRWGDRKGLTYTGHPAWPEGPVVRPGCPPQGLVPLAVLVPGPALRPELAACPLWASSGGREPGPPPAPAAPSTSDSGNICRVEAEQTH